MAAEIEGRVNLVFAVNGERFELSKVEPSITLLEFLRTRTRYTGTKLGCGEGGCGACVVLLSSYNSATEEVTDFSVSSCLTLLCSIHHCSITTTEGLGNSRDGPHSIHERFAGFHASQCGFCTPGMCMSLFSGLINADKTRRPVAREGFSKIMVSEAEKSIAGNLCRCTGYRPIVDACKSFAANVDLEDLGLNTFRKKGEMGLNANRLPTYIQDGVHTFPDFLKSEIKSSSNCSSRSFGRDPISITTAQLDSLSWYRPASIDELYYLLNSESISCTSYKMVVGNTGSGLYKDWDLGYKYIDLRGIPELTVIRGDDKGIEFGAAVTISKAIQVLEEENDKRPVFYKLADHMNKIASHFVRNTASLGGNLIMAQWKHFPSDLATVLLAVDASVTIQMPSERLVLTLEEFLEMSPFDHKTILLSIYIPSWKSVIKTSSNTDNLIDSVNRENSGILFETYRASPRPLGNFVAYLNSAFLARISSDEASGDPVLHDIRLAFGAYGVPHAIRAKKVEIFLTGKPITASVLLGAIRLLRETIIPEEGTSHREYRSSLAVAFLFSFLQPVSKGLAVPTKILGVEIRNGTSNAEYTNADTNKDVNNNDMLLSSTQIVEYSTEYYPVGEPTKKVGAVLQASGEAVYVDDIPSPKDCLYGAFIYSTKPLAHIKGIKFKPTLASEKIITVISVNDIPNGGKNIGSRSLFGSEPLFANTHTEYAGQPLGVVIAETQRFANIGARQVIVDYTKHLESPILSVDNAVKRSSFFLAPPFLIPKQIGDFSEGMAEADIKINSAEIKLGSQYYFYMETQTSLAVPDEDDCMVVYSSSQCPENTQSVISQCLGIPAHNVRVITRRVGGGFGGKALRSLPVAAACALAAHKLRRPVRMYLDRQTDMVMTGGRHPVEVIYTVGFKSDGKITALKLDILVNSGISEDISPVMPHNIIEALKKYNWGALSFDVKICKTNLTSKSAMRAPGELQGSYIAEAIIENVASSLGIDVNFVRKRNLHTFDSLVLFYEGSAGEAYEYTLPSIFDKLASFSVYNQRAEMTRNFNVMNKWMKRGISCVPIVHQVIVFGKPGKVSVLPDGSVVVEVGGVELGQGLWTKVKQMAAFALGQLWGDGSQDLLERVRVIQADTLSLVQGGFTSGSTTSEASCEAARLACKILVDRLKPLKDSLQEQMDLVTWDSLIAQATLQSVNLQANSYWVPDSSSSKYLNYGAAISEVEIDLLTGATTILQTDLIYDCGQSLNPAVDLGQIEGAFVQGIGFFMYEEYLSNSNGLVISDGTWTYKIPTVDTIPKQFNVELLNSGSHQKRVLSSKASGEPPLLLAASVHCATREAIRAARSELTTSQDGSEGGHLHFQLGVPATMPVVKELCGLDNVERFLEML